MENEDFNLDNEGQAGPKLAFDPNELKIVDTSSADYLKESALGGENFEQPPTDDTFNQEPTGGNNEPPQGDDNPQSGEGAPPASSGNEVFDEFKMWAEHMGLDVETKDFDLEKFDKERMDYEVGKYYAQKYFSKVDPRIHDLAQNGISLDDYNQAKNQYQSIVNTDATQLAKSQLFNQFAQSEYQLGLLQVDEQGNLTPESQQRVIDKVNQYAEEMGEEKVKMLGSQIQTHYKQELEKLPETMLAYKEQQLNQEVQNYNNTVNETIEAYKEAFKGENTLITPFSGEAEKEEFFNYMKENIELKQIDGRMVAPFMHKLEDKEFFATIMRLAYLHEKGAFTDIKNSERQAAFKKLGIYPLLGKQPTTHKPSQAGDGKIVNTWEQPVK